ncbi:MAG TPA: hypothetical protein VGK87_04550, partial [Anaerolineae bacterium]
DTVAASLAMVAIVSGVLLSLCAVAIPIISSGSMHTGIGVPSAVMGGLGMALSLLGGGVLRHDRMPHESVNAGKSPQRIRRLPVPRIPHNCLYRIVVPAAIGLIFLLIIAVIVVVVGATITPLVQ